VLSTAAGQRWRRAVELVIGVALGIAIGDALVLVIGVGVLQIAAVVILAMLATIALGGGNLAMSQAAASAVLVATLSPQTSSLHLDRFVDALVGGGVGLLVMALLLPFNPLTRVRHAAGNALVELTEALTATASALRERDPERARAALRRMRENDADYDDLRDSLAVGRETAVVAPIRWRTRDALFRYIGASVHVDRATRNVRVLVRRAASQLEDGEPVPDELPVAVQTLADAVATLRWELSSAVEPALARSLALDAVTAAARAYASGVGFSGSVVVAQIRSAATDLIRATGVSDKRAPRLVRRAARLAPGG
jgi:uncharacterized membrane protein YgaE (UPF0421/DUF939 family)